MGRIARLALVAFVVAGCGHANALPVDVVWAEPDDAYAQRADAEARPAAIAADVQFKQYGGVQGPVRVTAVRTDDGDVELRIHYRSDRAKCVSVRAVHVVVRDVPAGARKLVVLNNGSEISTTEIAVPPGPSAASGSVIAKLRTSSC